MRTSNDRIRVAYWVRLAGNRDVMVGSLACALTVAASRQIEAKSQPSIDHIGKTDRIELAEPFEEVAARPSSAAPTST
jgi:hypothetical protein